MAYCLGNRCTKSFENGQFYTVTKKLHPYSFCNSLQLALVLFPQNLLFRSQAQFGHFCRSTPEENVNNTCCSLSSYLLLSSSTL